jgi:hypothetical protein
MRDVRTVILRAGAGALLAGAFVLGCEGETRDSQSLPGDQRDARAVIDAIISAHRPPGTAVRVVIDPRVLRPATRDLETPNTQKFWTKASLPIAREHVILGDTSRLVGCASRRADCLGRPGEAVLSLTYPVVRGDTAYIEVHAERAAAPPVDGIVSTTMFEHGLYVLARDGKRWKVARRRVYNAA